MKFWAPLLVVAAILFSGEEASAWRLKRLRETSSRTLASLIPAPLAPLRTGKDCFQLMPDEGSKILAVKQRFGEKTFLVAQKNGEQDPVGQTALWATLEALVDNCQRPTGRSDYAPWFVSVGGGEHAVDALASSLGCATAVFDPDIVDAQSLEMTRCVNEPKEPFAIFPALAASETGKLLEIPGKPLENGKLGEKRLVPGVQLDQVFNQEGTTATGGVAAASWGGQIALLKVTPRSSCGASATLQALQGASKLLESGRVRCLLTELSFARNTTKDVLEILHGLERRGYSIAHVGSLDSPELEVGESGYPLFKTDYTQLLELTDKLDKIRKFDERSGYRAYSDGLSLDRDGRYFDYADLVVACRVPFPAKMKVYEKATLRFQDGKWWPEKQK